MTTTSGQAQVSLSWTAVAANHWNPAPGLTYTLYRDNGTTVEAVASNVTTRSHTDTGVTLNSTYSYQVAAVVKGGESTRSGWVSVKAGASNQPPLAMGVLNDLTLRVGGGTQAVTVSGAFQDPESDTLTFAASSSATTVATVSTSGAEVTITPVAAGRTTITVTATDASGSNTAATRRFTVTVWSATAVDYDSDDDGLIEIDSLAQLDAIRHDRGGDGGPTADGKTAYESAFSNAVEWMGCHGLEGCSGYELTADLDFDTNGNGTADSGDTYWNNGAGWAPIGGKDSLDFGSTFLAPKSVPGNLRGQRPYHQPPVHRYRHRALLGPVRFYLPGQHPEPGIDRRRRQCGVNRLCCRAGRVQQGRDSHELRHGTGLGKR